MSLSRGRPVGQLSFRGSPNRIHRPSANHNRRRSIQNIWSFPVRPVLRLVLARACVGASWTVTAKIYRWRSCIMYTNTPSISEMQSLMGKSSQSKIIIIKRNKVLFVSFMNSRTKRWNGRATTHSFIIYFAPYLMKYAASAPDHRRNMFDHILAPLKISP